MANSHSNPNAALSDRLYREHASEIRSHLRTFNDEIAGEATSFAFFMVVRGYLAADHANPVAWLRLVAYREALRLTAIEARSGQSLDAAFSDEDTLTLHDVTGQVGSDPAFHAEINESLGLLRHLKPQQAKVLFLHWAGYSYEDIEAELGVTRTWINRHMYEGRLALRKLREEGGAS